MSEGWPSENGSHFDGTIRPTVALLRLHGLPRDRGRVAGLVEIEEGLSFYGSHREESYWDPMEGNLDRDPPS